MELLPCGTLIKTKLGSIDGMITAISIKFDKVAYEVSYFDSGSTQKSIWMHEDEFETKVENRYSIGFRKAIAVA